MPLYFQKLHLDPTIPCPDCDKLFHNNNYLQRHRNSVHKLESSKKYFCDKCQKGFALKTSYDGHLNMHAGLKPYKCNYCHMCYQNKPNMHAHERKSHPEEYKGDHSNAGQRRVSLKYNKYEVTE